MSNVDPICLTDSAVICDSCRFYTSCSKVDGVK